MYTVARFNAPPEGRQALETFVSVVNATTDEAILTPRARGDGFACSLTDDGAWDEHVEAIARFLAAHGKPIQTLVEAGGHAEFDTAVDPDDLYGDRLYTDFFFAPELMRSLSTVGARAGFTFYPGDRPEAP
jgi:hypothetical protein